MYARVLTYFTLVGVIIIVSVSYLIEYLLKIPLGSVTLLGEQYWAGMNIIPVILTSYLFFGFYVMDCFVVPSTRDDAAIFWSKCNDPGFKLIFA